MSIISTSITTQRLVLRPWKLEDFDPFFSLNADPRVMEYFPSVLNRQESDELALRIKTKLEEKGWGMWAATLIASGEFIGFIGLNEVTQSTLPAPFSPAVEVGWRLAFEHWGKGYATEGALASLQYGFHILHLKEIISFTAVQNQRSRHVMEKIGMHRDPKGDFDHPKLAEGHWLRRHVLYRLQAREWQK